MALAFKMHGKYLEATFTSRVSVPQISTFLRRFCRNIESALIVLHDLTALPLTVDIQAAQPQVRLDPTARLAFIGHGTIAFTFAHVLAALCGVPDHCVFQSEQDALDWLDQCSP